MRFAGPAFKLMRAAMLIAAVVSLVGLAGKALAQLRVDITQGTIQPMPIAIPPFVGAGGGVDELSQNVAQVVTADLKRSGLFAPVDPSAFIEPVVPPTVTPNFANWRPLSAQALVSGSVAPTGDGRIMAEYRLWDVVSGSTSSASSSSPRPRIGGGSPTSSRTPFTND
jgi:TolB protein